MIVIVIALRMNDGARSSTQRLTKLVKQGVSRLAIAGDPNCAITTHAIIITASGSFASTPATGSDDCPQQPLHGSANACAT